MDIELDIELEAVIIHSSESDAEIDTSTELDYLTDYDLGTELYIIDTEATNELDTKRVCRTLEKGELVYWQQDWKLSWVRTECNATVNAALAALRGLVGFIIYSYLHDFGPFFP